MKSLLSTISKTCLCLSISGFAATMLAEGDPSLDVLFPIPENVHKILESRCYICHGEIINGKAEIREDLDMTTEANIRETLYDLETLLEVIEEDEMPQKGKPSFRFRKDPAMTKRIKDLRAEYAAKPEEKKILLDWINGIKSEVE